MALDVPTPTPDQPPSAFYLPVDVDSRDFRVLILEAGSKGETLKCRLEHVSLTDSSTNQSYETISYVWGNAAVRGEIEIDGHVVNIPANSRDALLRMRRVSGPRKLWIDSVCINQTDSVERSHQVALMSDIYSSSTGNLVWLGDADDTTESALTSIQLVLDEVKLRTPDLDAQTEFLYGEHGFLLWEIATIRAVIDYEACWTFFSSKWFNRRWVVQEVALAPTNTAHCGRFERPLEDILLAAAYIHYHYLTWSMLGCCPGVFNASVMHNFSGGWYDRRLKAGKDVSLRLIPLLRDLRSFDNDEPKDCLYAVLALYQKYNSKIGTLPSLIQPDYTLPLATILHRVVVHCQAGSRTLDILNDAQRLNEDVPDDDPFPTWVPRYDLKLDLGTGSIPLVPNFRADDEEEWQEWRPRPEDLNQTSWSTRLLVKGYRLGTVSAVTSKMLDKMFTEAEYTLTQLEEIDAVLESAKLQAPRNEVLGITLCASRDYQAQIMDPADATAAFTDYEEHIRQNGTTPPWPFDLLDTATEVERRRSTYMHEVFSVCPTRRFFATDEGHVGVGRQCTAAGDVLAIAFGCQWPVILRPVTSTESAYRFIGTAYVYDIMFGEATRKMQAEGQRIEEFALV